MLIQAPKDRAITVEVFEPRQSPEQEECIIERFDLKAGDEVDYEMPSGTAAYRVIPQGLDTRPEDYDDPVPDQEGDLSPSANEEVQLGQQRSQELQNDERARTSAEAGNQRRGARSASEGGAKSAKKSSTKTGSKTAAKSRSDTRADAPTEERQPDDGA